VRDEILSLGIGEVVEGVREGSLAPREIVEAYVEQIEVQEPEIRAFLSLDLERARARARLLEEARAKGEELGPLAGVPLALKDNLTTIDFPTTAGSRILEGWRPSYDATVVARVEAAGAIVLGKTNLDEFAMGSSTENSAYQVTRNPWDLDRVPGGSSGGSAAAVGARMALVALGSDTGGSIRQPAALCGVVGFKPTYGRVSRYGMLAFASSLDQIGPIANSVADAAILLAVISGQDPMDATSLALGPTDPEPTVDVRGLRVGVVTNLMDHAAPEVADAVRAGVGLLEGLGARVDAIELPALEFGLSAYYVVAPAEASSNLARYDGVRYGLREVGATVEEMMIRTRTHGFGPEVKRRIMLGTYVLSAGYYDAFYVTAQRVRTLVKRAFAEAYARFDVLVAPTSPTTAFAIGERTSDPVAMYRSDVCTIPSNLAGDPALSVPVGFDEAGLPIGLQLMGPAGSDELLLGIGRALEVARG
jgi:aspartyl-tRNA(Asn)/glutamyl-tRNA(Gln) amidotransferase subunit A